MSAIIKIADVAINQDQQGRYRLNDLQKAATIGLNSRTVEVHEFMRRPETQDLIKEITDTGNSRIDPVSTSKGGYQQGTYVCKELVYAYAMWISPSFHLKVIRFFDTATTTDPLAHIPPEHRALVALLCENAEIKATQAVQAESIKRIEAKQSAFEDGASYFTVIGYGSMHGAKVSTTNAVRIGKRAAAYSKVEGISIEKVRDVRFGLVNSYHESVLDTAFAEVMGGAA